MQALYPCKGVPDREATVQNPCNRWSMNTPPGTRSCLGLIPGTDTYFVFVAAPPLTPGMHLLDLLRRPGSLTLLLTHEEGVALPDRKGTLLAETMLGQGGSVVMQFASMTDALNANRQLNLASADG